MYKIHSTFKEAVSYS